RYRLAGAHANDAVAFEMMVQGGGRRGNRETAGIGPRAVDAQGSLRRSHGPAQRVVALENEGSSMRGRGDPRTSGGQAPFAGEGAGDRRALARSDINVRSGARIVQDKLGGVRCPIAQA